MVIHSLNRTKKGFTIIELVIVIALLAVLAAIAVSLFIDPLSKARTSSVKGMEGALHSALLLARSQYKVEGSSTATSVDMDGTSVTVGAGNGRPTGDAAGMGTALKSFSGFGASYAGTVATFQPDEGGSATCQVTYDGSDGSITTTTTGC